MGKTEGRRKGQHTVRWLGGVIDSMDVRVSKHWEAAKDTEAWVLQSIRSQSRT